MATVEMIMPKMGESVMEGTILSWLKQVGDTIEEDESVLEVATDKVDTEIPSAYKGVLKEILAKEGDVVAVGKPIALIETEATNKIEKSTPSITTDQSSKSQNTVSAKAKNAVAERFYSPLVKSIAKTENISQSELDEITGSGKEGRVTKEDILSYLGQRKNKISTPVGGILKTVMPMPVSITGEDEIIEMDRMRKMIAERMVASRAISAHVTSFVEADMTKVVKWRAAMKTKFLESDGQILTFTPIILQAVVKAIKDYPMINIQVDGTRIIKKGSINIGMAVALPSGNLIVPVIHHADQMSLLGLTQKVNDLAKRARSNELKPDELSGGTFTVSNVGSFGNVMGTPIIMQPQVAILAVGAIQKKPAVIETDQGDFIGIRHKMFLSHSYDHRVVDGALGGMFVRRVADYLEQFDISQNT